MSLSLIVMKDGSLSGVVNGKPFAVSQSHPNYAGLVECAKVKDADGFESKLDFVEHVQTATAGKVTVENGEVKFGGQPINHVVTKHLLRMLKEGFDITPLALFLERSLNNPSSTSSKEGYDFLEVHGLPITEDGCFLAYKAVDSNYMDKFSRKHRNKIGDEPRMKRNEVDDDRRNDCSFGFHVGALEYSGPNGWYFREGDHCMIVKVDPADIVSVPLDHNCRKMRVCGYKVIAEYTGELNKPVYRNDEVPSSYTPPVDEDADYDELFDEVDPYDVNIGDRVEFDYNCETRYLEVTDISPNGERWTGVLLRPEVCAFEYRSFKVDYVENVRYYEIND